MCMLRCQYNGGVLRRPRLRLSPPKAGKELFNCKRSAPSVTTAPSPQGRRGALQPKRSAQSVTT
eukprot:2176092-Pleurochrysis_carterae.AAC.2